MKKTIIGSVIAMFVLVGLVWIARPGAGDTSAPSESTEALAVEGERNYDFGSISMAAGKVRYSFRVKNTWGTPVTIGKIYTSCMCTTAIFKMREKNFGPYGMPGHGALPNINQTINPNEEATVEVVFDPAAHGPAGVGRIERKVILENNTGRPVELQFTAIVTP